MDSQLLERLPDFLQLLGLSEEPMGTCFADDPPPRRLHAVPR